MVEQTARRCGYRWKDAVVPALLIAGTLAVLMGLLTLVVSQKQRGLFEARAADEPAAEEKVRGVFVRPGVVAPGGTYEVYVDVEDAAFSEETVVAVASANTMALEAHIRNEKGMTLIMGVAANERPGEIEVAIETPLADGTVDIVDFVLTVAEPGATGPGVAFQNVPAGDRLIVEGGFAHFELAVEGDGPFVVEFGLREKSFWSSRPWNTLNRAVAEEREYAIEGPEQEAFTVALPSTVNTVDIVVIDRNGYEYFQSVVVETQNPCRFEEVEEVGLLEKLFGSKVACASCETTNPTFSFTPVTHTGYDQERDDDGTEPLEFTDDTCQGTVCNSCSGCGGGSLDKGLDDGAIFGGGGGSGGPRAPRPDGYAPPTRMMSERGKVFGHNGEYKYTVTDLSVPVPGLSFAIQRTYRSQIHYHGRLGKNWDMNIFARYIRYGTASGGTATATGDMYFYRGDGRRDKYTHTSGTNFTSPDGFYDKFLFATSAYSQEIRKKDGSRWVFSETQVGGDVVFGRLNYISARSSSNYLHFQYDGSCKLTKISSSTGIDLNVAYDGNGYLASITQAEDATHWVKYYYDTGATHDGLLDYVEYASTDFSEYNAQGTLTEHSSTSKRLAYDYFVNGAYDDETDPLDLKYNLTGVYDGRGNTASLRDYPIVALVYDSSDRVDTYEIDPDYDVSNAWTEVEFTSYGTDGSGNKTATYKLKGYNSQATPTFVNCLKQVDVTYDSSTGGLLTKVVKTSAGNTLATWEYERSCGCNQATKIEDPNGHIVFQYFDTYGNLTKRVVDDGDGVDNDATDLVTLYKYDYPNYVSSAEYGGVRERAEPDKVASPSTTIGSIAAADKHRWEYYSNGNLSRVKPPAFKHASEFSDATDHQGEIRYSVYNTYGQVGKIEVYLDATELKEATFTYYTSGDEKSLIWKITVDPTDLAIETEYEYDVRRDLTKVYDPLNNATEYTLTGDRLIAEINPPTASADDNREFWYDANNNLVKNDVAANTSGNRFDTYHVYNGINQEIETEQQVDATPTTVTTERSYDGEGRMVKVSETGGKVRRTQYEHVLESGAYYLMAKVYGSGTSVSEFILSETQYEGLVRPIRVKTYIDEVTDATPDFAGTWFAYDDYGRRILTVTSPDSDVLSGFAGTKTFYAELVSYNADSKVIASERGEVATTSTYSQLLATTYTYKSITETDYDDMGQQIRTTRYQEYERAGTSGTPTTESDPLIQITKHGFDGRVVTRRKVLDSGNADTTYAYDDAGRMEAITHPDGQSTTEYDFDDNGNVLTLHSKEYDASGPTTKDYVTEYLYDKLNRITTRTIEGYNNSGLGSDYDLVTYEYDHRGNIATQTQEIPSGTNDIVTEYTHDGLNRLIKTEYDTDTVAIVNEVIYDDADREVTRRDGAAGPGYQDTVYAYRPALDVVAKITYPNDSPPSDPDNHWYTHDRAGRILYSIAAGSSAPSSGTHDKAYEYNLLGWATSRTLGSPGSGTEASADFTYDFLGRVSTAKTKLQGSATYDSEVTRTYNSLFMIEEEQKKFAVAATFTIKTHTPSATGYDAGGRRERLEYHKDTGLSSTRVLRFGYDSSDRATNIVENIGVDVTIAQYDYAGPEQRVRKARLYYGGSAKLEKQITHDHLLRPTETDYRQYGSSTVVKYTEGWGDGDWADGVTETQWCPIFARDGFKKTTGTTPGTLRSYTYDGVGRLSKKVDTGTILYTCDDSNCRTGKTGSTYGYNTSSEITSATGFTSLLHDSHGNLTYKVRSSGAITIQTFSYDKMDRLAYYRPQFSTAWQYYFDGLGRRVKKAKTDGSEKYYYFYDGPRVVLEIIEKTGQSAQVKEYVYGNGIDEVLIEYLPDGGSNRTFWPCSDSLGTVRDLADLDGSNNARFRMQYGYDPDGTVTSETVKAGTNTVTQDILFTGRRLDRETAVSGTSGALYHYRTRAYDPELARFMQRDAIGMPEIEVRIGNEYEFAKSNPVNGGKATGNNSRGQESGLGKYQGPYYMAAHALRAWAAAGRQPVKIPGLPIYPYPSGLGGQGLVWCTQQCLAKKWATNSGRVACKLCCINSFDDLKRYTKAKITALTRACLSVAPAAPLPRPPVGVPGNLLLVSIVLGIAVFWSYWKSYQGRRRVLN